MTADESQKCHQCKYRTILNSNKGYEHICCYYIVCKGTRRGCSVDDCDKYKKGGSIGYNRYIFQDHREEKI